MRWKLLIITSLVAALLSAGGMHALIYWTTAYVTPLSRQPYVVASLFIIPFVVAALASIFVYRHTARRRKLQATLTALLSIILTLGALLIIAQVLPEPPDEVRSLPTLKQHHPA